MLIKTFCRIIEQNKSSIQLIQTIYVFNFTASELSAKTIIQNTTYDECKILIRLLTFTFKSSNQHQK